MDDGRLVSIIEHKGITDGTNEDLVKLDQVPNGGDGQVESVMVVVSSSNDCSLQL